jgi:dTMP kinase
MPSTERGLFLVLEGGDGTGKGTQTELLNARLIDSGQEVEKFDFPQYGTPSAHFVERYLNGDYGPASKVGPYRASVFYALDRFEAGERIERSLAVGRTVLSNRYVASNLAHQGCQLPSDKREAYFEWNTHFEYEILQVPKPALNIVLYIKPELAQELIDRKADREYTKGKKRDMLEADLDHLRNAAAVYEQLCLLFPEFYVRIDCMNDDGTIRAIEEVHELIWAVVESELIISKEVS